MDRKERQKMKEGVEEKTARGRKGKVASLTKKIKEAVGERIVSEK